MLESEGFPTRECYINITYPTVIYVVIIPHYKLHENKMMLFSA